MITYLLLVVGLLWAGATIWALVMLHYTVSRQDACACGRSLAGHEDTGFIHRQHRCFYQEEIR